MTLLIGLQAVKKHGIEPITIRFDKIKFRMTKMKHLAVHFNSIRSGKIIYTAPPTLLILFFFDLVAGLRNLSLCLPVECLC